MSDTPEVIPHYSMVPEWSVEDDASVGSAPEFPGEHTQGATYEDAVSQRRDLTDLLLLWALQDGKPLPQLPVFAGVWYQVSGSGARGHRARVDFLILRFSLGARSH
jgi:predicted RNase H-like HicB family nuclease